MKEEEKEDDWPLKKRAVTAEYGRTGATMYGNILEGNISFVEDNRNGPRW